jgi:catechol 2,3-dioxygenase-like lactoylglutathione lyase family enzyme
MSYNHPNSERTGSLHHVELSSSNLERSTAFWDWLLGELGYEPNDEWETGRSWLNEPVYIVLKQAANTEVPFDRNAPGLNHIAFHAGSREQVDELTASVRERGDSTVLYDEQHPYAGGYYALYCENLDGVKVEIVAPD